MKKTVLLTLIITAILLSCNDDKTPDPVLCDCAETYGTTAHLGIDGNGNVATCPCPATEKPCGCTEQTAALDGIAIRKQADISVADMNAAVANIGNVYNGNDMFPADRTKFKTKVTQIHIVSGNGVVLEGTVLKVGSGATETAIFDCIADYVLP